MTRPTIIGTAIRQIDLHYEDRRSKNKDYRIIVARGPSGECRVYYEHGPAGRLNQGGEKTAAPLSESAAMRLAGQLAEEKRHGRDPYWLVGDQRFDLAKSPPPQPVSPPPTRRGRPTRTAANTLSSPYRALIDSVF